MIIGLISLLSYFCSAYLFVIKWDYQIKGIAFSFFTFGFTFLLGILITISYVQTELKEAIFVPTRETFNDWGEWFRLAVPGILLFFFGTGVYEVYVIVSG